MKRYASFVVVNTGIELRAPVIGLESGRPLYTFTFVLLRDTRYLHQGVAVGGITQIRYICRL